MAKINSIDDIETIKVHWSESNHINEVMGCDENSDIEKEVTPIEFEAMIQTATPLVGTGYDKTSLSIKLKSGILWCHDSKFYLSSKDTDLLSLLNKGEDDD